MDPSTQKSILQMAKGAIQERADYEMSRLLANILDPNTSATAKRKLTLTLEMVPLPLNRVINVMPKACRVVAHPAGPRAKKQLRTPAL